MGGRFRGWLVISRCQTSRLLSHGIAAAAATDDDRREKV
jgi:hypothetical protein